MSIEQKAFEAFNILVAAGQDTPARRHLRILVLLFWIVDLCSTFVSLPRAVEASHDVHVDSLKHLTHSPTKAILMIDATSAPEDLRSLFAAGRTERTRRFATQSGRWWDETR